MTTLLRHSSIILQQLSQRDTVGENNNKQNDTIQKPFPTAILVPIVLIIVLSVLAGPIICCLICCRQKRRQKRAARAADKRLYLHDRATEPGLTLKMWTARRKQAAIAAQLARTDLVHHPGDDLDFPMFPTDLPHPDRDLSAKRPGTLGLLRLFLTFFVVHRKEVKEETRARAMARLVGDEERLVRGEVPAGLGAERKTQVWEKQVPPAYSTVNLEEI